MSIIENYPCEVRERAAIYEYEANMSREDAEDRAITEFEAGEIENDTGAKQCQMIAR